MRQSYCWDYDTAGRQSKVEISSSHEILQLEKNLNNCLPSSLQFTDFTSDNSYPRELAARLLAIFQPNLGMPTVVFPRDTHIVDPILFFITHSIHVTCSTEPTYGIPGTKPQKPFRSTPFVGAPHLVYQLFVRSFIRSIVHSFDGPSTQQPVRRTQVHAGAVQWAHNKCRDTR